MIITCPQCSTKFLAPDESIGADGRRVRCGKCSNIWHQDPMPKEQAEENKKIAARQQENIKQAIKDEAAGKKPSLPAVIKEIPVPNYMKYAAIALFVLNCFGFVYYNKAMIGHTSFYDIVGQYVTDGVKIKSAKYYDITDEDKKTSDKEYKIVWTIENTSQFPRKFPHRKISLLDKDKQVLIDGSEGSELTLKSGESQEVVVGSALDEGGKAKYLVLEVGNPYDLSSR